MLRNLRLSAIAAVGFIPPFALLAGFQLGAPVPYFTAAIALLALALSVGWPSLTAVPAPNTARLVLVLTASLSIALAAKWPASHLAVLLAAGIGLPLVFARELIRPAPREHLVRSSTATATGVLAVATMGFWVEAAALPHLLDLTAIASCAIAGSCIALSLGQFLSSWRWRREASAVVGVLLAALAGAGLSFLVAVPWAAGAAVAAACGVAPAALWLADSRRDLFDGVLCLRDAALLVLPLSVTSVPVWAAALMR